MRKHVGKRKTEDIEYLEELVGEPVSDEVWNALAKLNGVQIMALAHWIKRVIIMNKP